MKRKIALVLTGIMICSALSACGSTGASEASGAADAAAEEEAEDISAELTAATDQLFAEVQNYNSDYLNTVCVDENGNAYSFSDAENAEEGTAATEEETGTEGELEMEAIQTYLQDCACKVTYTIDSIDEENLTVTVTSNFVDSSEVWSNYLVEALSAAFAGEDTEDDAVIADCFNKAVADVTEETMVSNQSVIYYEKTDDGYAVKSVSEDFYDVVTANSLNAWESLGEATDDSAYTDAAADVACEGIDTTQGLVYKVTNNSTIDDLCIEINTVFYDTDGNMIYTDDEYISNLTSGTTFYSPTYCDQEYASYETTISTSQSYYLDVTDQITVDHNGTSDGVAVKMTNNGDTEVLEVEIAVVYYKDGTMVGCQLDYGNDIQPGQFEASTVYVPYSYIDYNDISYDTYELYYLAIASEY